MTKGTRGKPFTKGNPGGGRKKIPASVTEACRLLTEDAIGVLKKILLNELARDADRLRAAEALLNRGWGMPSQSLELLKADVQEMPRVITVQIIDPRAEDELSEPFRASPNPCESSPKTRAQEPEKLAVKPRRAGPGVRDFMS